MSHINIKTGNLELPYVDKIYITEDKTSYISLNTGKVVYLDNNQTKTYQFDMGRKPYKMLSYLMENNGDFVPSDTIYYDVFGQNITEKQDSIVDEVRRTLWKIACIKCSDIKIKKHSGGETAFPGYTLILPDQSEESLGDSNDGCGNHSEIIDKDDSYNNQIDDGLEMLMVDFINTTDLSTETNISFMTDDKRLTRILQLANQLKGTITRESDISLVLKDMIDDRVSKYVECKEACLCIRDCGEYLGQNTLNDEVISNVHFIACFESYAQTQGYIIDKNICLCNPNDFINLFVAVLQSPEGTKEFLDSIFYGPDRIIIYMQEGKERLLKTFYKFRGDCL